MLSPIFHAFSFILLFYTTNQKNLFHAQFVSVFNAKHFVKFYFFSHTLENRILMVCFDLFEVLDIPQIVNHKHYTVLLKIIILITDCKNIFFSKLMIYVSITNYKNETKIKCKNVETSEIFIFFERLPDRSCD